MWGWGIHISLGIYGNVYTFHSCLALNSTHIISEASNSYTLFVLMLIIIVLSFVDWRHGWGVFSTCEDEGFTYPSVYGNVYTFHSFLALNSTHIISEASNSYTIFVLMLIIIVLSFVDWRHGWGVFSTCENEGFTYPSVYGNVYTFHSFLALNSTLIISEASNFTTIFVLMLTIIVLSFMNWRHGWGVFSTCENEGFTYPSVYSNVYTLHSFLALNSTLIISEASNFTTIFVLMLTIIVLSFVDWRHGWGVFSTCENEEFAYPSVYVNVYTFHSFLALNSTHIISEASNSYTIFVLMIIIIVLSFVNWRHGWGVFSTCEDEEFTYPSVYTAMCTRFIAV